jgi:zinc protease
VRAAMVPVWACLLLVASGAIDSAPASKIFPYETHRVTLDNGLNAILVPMNSAGLVAYWSIVRTGARDEYEPGHTGFAHFFEHMMFRGSENYTRDEREKIVTGMGADTNAFTSDDLTAYYLNIAAEDLEKVMQLESDRFVRLKYAEPDFKTEAGAVYGEYRKNRMSPFFTLYEAVHQEAYDVHTYGHTAMGYEQDIKAMPDMYEYSRSFFARYYRPENVVILVIGDIDVGRTKNLLQEHYGGWQAGYEAPKVPGEPEQSAEKRIDVPYQGQTLPILWIAYKVDAFDPSNVDFVSADLLCQLAFGETSDFHKKMVLDEQVIEFIDADVNANRDPGLLDIVTRIKDETKVDYVLSEIDATIDHYMRNAPEAQRLADLKSRLKYDFLMGLDTPMNVARALVRIIAVTGGIDAVDELYSTYEQITPARVQGAARKYMVSDHRTVAILRGGES